MSGSAGYLYNIDEIVPGTKLRVRKHLGQGGMGSVYEVSAPPRGERYVLKVVHPHLLKATRIRERLRKEAILLTEFEHPNIVQVVFTGETADDPPLPYYVMERLYGCALSDALQRLEGNGLPLVPTFEIMMELLSALSYAHDRGVVHRDVKLDNVFLHFDPNGIRVTKLLDFGIVRVLSEARATMAGFVGTLGNAAPEQLRNEDPTPACDIYATGVTLYQMITCHDPYGELADPQAILRAHLFNVPTPASTYRVVPHQLDKLLLAMLEKEPGNRPQAREVFDAMRDLTSSIAGDARFERSEVTQLWLATEARLRDESIAAATTPDTFFAPAEAGRQPAGGHPTGGAQRTGGVLAVDVRQPTVGHLQPRDQHLEQAPGRAWPERSQPDVADAGTVRRTDLLPSPRSGTPPGLGAGWSSSRCENAPALISGFAAAGAASDSSPAHASAPPTLPHAGLHRAGAPAHRGGATPGGVPIRGSIDDDHVGPVLERRGTGVDQQHFEHSGVGPAGTVRVPGISTTSAKTSFIVQPPADASAESPASSVPGQSMHHRPLVLAGSALVASLLIFGGWWTLYGRGAGAGHVNPTAHATTSEQAAPYGGILSSGSGADSAAGAVAAQAEHSGPQAGRTTAAAAADSVASGNRKQLAVGDTRPGGTTTSGAVPGNLVPGPGPSASGSATSTRSSTIGGRGTRGNPSKVGSAKRPPVVTNEQKDTFGTLVAPDWGSIGAGQPASPNP